MLESATRPAQRPGGSDRDCPLDTVIDPPIWHANGTAARQMGPPSESADDDGTCKNRATRPTKARVALLGSCGALGMAGCRFLPWGLEGGPLVSLGGL
jgi:hypothetical protein